LPPPADGGGLAMTLALTFFTTCKPFRGAFEVIQRNALRSWKEAYPSCEVIVFGDEPGVSECCREFGLRQIPAVGRSEHGTPLLNSLLQQAEDAATSDILVYINADIMLTGGLIPALEAASCRFDKFLLIARRWNVELTTAWNFAVREWEANLRRLAYTAGSLEPPYGGIDLFAYSRGIWQSIPPFAVGRTRWDSALLYRARRLHVPIIDATDQVVSLHPNHDYSHVPRTPAGTAKGPEAAVNAKLLGGDEFIFTPLNATHRLTRSGIRRNRVFYPPYVLRRLATLPALYPSLRAFAPAVRYLAPSWRKIKRRVSA
jgi:hypothetical protein